MNRTVKFRQLLRRVADRLGTDDCELIETTCELDIHDGLDSLEILIECTKRGHFSESDVGGLEKLLQSINRRDVLPVVTEYMKNVSGKTGEKDDAEASAVQKFVVGDVVIIAETTKWNQYSYTSLKLTISSAYDAKSSPFSIEIRIPENDHGFAPRTPLECRLPSAFGEDGGKVFIGEKDVLAMFQQGQSELTEVSGLVDELEKMVYRQRERVLEQSAVIKQQEEAISDLYSKFVIMFLFLLHPLCENHDVLLHDRKQLPHSLI